MAQIVGKKTITISADAQDRAVRTQNLIAKYPNLQVLPETAFLLRVHTMIRAESTPRTDFLFYSEQLMRSLVEYTFEQCEYKEKTVITPTGHSFAGLELAKDVIAVSIMRAGESMENAVRQTIRAVKIGKILIQRDETQETKPAKLFYSKLPDNIHTSTVLLLDPMLASGSSARLAIQVLIEKGVPVKDIIFVNLVAAPEGIEVLMSEFPELRVVTTFIDRGMNDQKYILPGLGDFGDRYFGTS